MSGDALGQDGSSVISNFNVGFWPATNIHFPSPPSLQTFLLPRSHSPADVAHCHSLLVKMIIYKVSRVRRDTNLRRTLAWLQPPTASSPPSMCISETDQLQDLITGDEIISDSYDLKEIDGVAYEADCKLITVGGESFDTGANASAEEAGDDVEDSSEKVLDIVHSFRLTSTSFDKKSYLGHLKDYMKKVKTALKEKGASEDEIKTFETGAQGFAKKIVGSFKDYEFYIGESMDPDGM